MSQNETVSPNLVSLRKQLLLDYCRDLDVAFFFLADAAAEADKTAVSSASPATLQRSSSWLMCMQSTPY